MTEKIKKLMEARQAAIAKARAILDAAEGRALNVDEQKQYDGFDAEVDSLATRIQAEERQEALEAEMRESANGAANPATRSQPGRKPGAGDDRTASPEYRKALLGYKAWQAGRLGRDINPSTLIGMLMEVNGVKRVNLTAPVFTILADGSDNSTPALAKAGTVTVTNGGYEDE